MRLPDPVRNGLTRLLERDAAARGEQPPALPEVSPPSQKHPLPARLALWLNEATGQMRWKRARPYAADELAGHLTDQYEAFRDQGMDEAHAAEATIREMGDAVETGTALDRAWRPAPDWVMLGLVLGVAVAGIMLQYLLHTIWPDAGGPSPTLLRQVIAYLAGAVCLFAGYFLDYTWLGRHAKTTYAVWLLATVGAIFISPMANGKLLYPEYAVWMFPAVFAAMLYAQRGKGTKGVAVCMVIMLPMVVTAFIVPTFTAIVTLGLVCTVLLCSAVWQGYFSGNRKRQLVLALSPVALFAVYMGWRICTNAHVRERMMVAFYPALDIDNRGYMGATIWEALFGGIVASEMSERRLNYYRADTSDFMLTAVKMQWGWIAFALVLTVVLVLLARGFQLAHRQGGVLAKMMSWAIMLTFACQTMAYVLQNFGIILFAAYGLPLFSYGGLYLCQTMLLFGLLLSTRRTGQIESGAKPVRIGRKARQARGVR